MTARFTEIDYWLMHTVDINHVTVSRGDISRSTEEDVPTRILERTEVLRESGGDSIGTSDVTFRATVLYFKPSQTLGLQDEIVIDSLVKPIKRIETIRDSAGIRLKRVFV